MQESFDDYHVVQHILQGRQECFAILVNRYKNKVFSIFRSKGTSYQDAQDLTQETFLKAYRNIKSFRNDGSFAAWIYTIAVNLQKDRFKVKGHIFTEENQENLRDESFLPEDAYLLKEFRHRMHELINELPEMYRIPLLLRYTNDLTYEEICNVTGLSNNEVRNGIYRAKKALKQMLLRERGSEENGILLK